MPAIRYTKTAVDTDTPWDAEAAVDALPDDAKAATLRREFAWVDGDEDPDNKTAYKFPHHFVDADGKVGAASSKACSAGIAALNGARGGTDIPDSDRQGVYEHLAAHLRDAKLNVPELKNGLQAEKHSTTVNVEQNALNDEGDGIIMFPNGQVISDGSQHRNGIRYDIPSLDLTEFNGTVTADHVDMVQSVVAKTVGLTKRGEELVISGLKFAVKESPFAQMVYDLMRGGYVKDLSTETYGMPPDETGLITNSKLVGLSVVVTGNNRNATINSVIKNSLETARKNGLDTTEAEKALGVDNDTATPVKGEEQQLNKKKDLKEMAYKTIKNGRDFPVKVTYKNAAGEDVETELAPGAGVDVSEEQAGSVEQQVASAQDNQAALNAIEKKFEDRFASFEKNLLDKTAKEPEFKVNNGKTRRNGIKGSEVADLDWKESTALQLQSLQASFRGDREAGEIANTIRKVNFDKLQQEGLVSNALDLPDLGNFVIPPEMIREIKQQNSNYRPLLDTFRFEETMSLDTAWLTGTNELEMHDVEMNNSPTDADLKPIEYPTFDTEKVSLKEFAAVTPVKSSAIRFSAVDLVSNLTSLYRRAYDRALAESIIGRLQQAVDTTGNKVPYNFSASAGGDVEALVALITAWSDVAEHVSDGTYLMTMKSYLHLTAMALRSGTNGPLANIFTLGPNSVPQFLSRPYVIVPSDLMPSLNTADTRVLTFEGETVTVDSGVLFAQPDDFVGRVSGGLNFQVSDSAAYEENNAVKSAWQRDELVFRGYGYRASGLYFPENVSAVTAAGIS